MKTRFLSFLLILSLLWFFTGITFGQNQEENKGQKQNPSQERIEKYIQSLKGQIERTYEERFAQLQSQADAQNRLFESTDNTGTACTEAQALIAESLFNLLTYGSPEKDDALTSYVFTFKDDIDEAPQHFVAARYRLIEERNRTAAFYSSKLLELEAQRQYSLTVRLPELEKRLKENLAAEPSKNQNVITAIVYSSDKPSAILNGKIIHKNDSISGVQILDISSAEVVFKKGGTIWKQKVGVQDSQRWQ